MNSITFEPQLTSTPKKIISTLIPDLCSTPLPIRIRWSLSRYVPLPVDSSTPNAKKKRKSIIPDLHHLIYPSTISTKHSTQVWVL